MHGETFYKPVSKNTETESVFLFSLSQALTISFPTSPSKVYHELQDLFD